MNKILSKFEKAVNELTVEFIQKYYCDEQTTLEDIDYDWVADEIGGVLAVSDYFHGLEDIVNAMRYNAPKDKFFAYYDYCMERHITNKHPEYNMRSYLKLK